MSLFNRAGLSASDMQAIEKALTEFMEGLKDRFHGLDSEIEDLRKEIAALKAEPRTSLAQRLRTKK